MDPIEITKKLITFPSITPLNAGCLDYIEQQLSIMGFMCKRAAFGDVDNLYARFGTAKPNICFAGHVDVVEPGDLDSWIFSPFSGTIDDNKLFGRGAVDMKGAIGAFICACAAFINDFNGVLPFSISILLTCDEEGPAINGTQKMLEWIYEDGDELDFCLVGEPTNPNYIGEMVKIGRRGSLSAHLTIIGQQGHVAYPQNAINPINQLIDVLKDLTQYELDQGTLAFDPSHLEITSVDVGNTVGNIIPQTASARFNIRFNSLHSFESLEELIHSILKKRNVSYEISFQQNAQAFITSSDGPLIKIIAQAIEQAIGKKPILSTSGGTSDARFIKNYCPVVEFGLINKTAHQINEYVDLSDLESLKVIYLNFLNLCANNIKDFK